MLKSTIYIREYFYTTLSGMDIEYRALSYKELENIKTKYDTRYNQSHIAIIKCSLLIKEDFNKLTQKDIDILYTKIVDNSIVTNEEMDTIEASISILMEDTFKDDTFKSCKLCQERKLDTQRNCPLLHESTHDKMVFYIIGNKKVKVCPMDKVNSPIIGDSLRCNNILESGQLPMTGGMYDQTMFFVEVGSLVKGIINRHQAEAMKKK